MALTMDACCDDVETISTCSGGSDQDSPWPWMPWPDTDDECCYPKSDYRPPRECLETACLAMLLTTQKKPRSAELPEEDTKSTLEPGKALKITSEKSAMQLHLKETVKFSEWVLKKTKEKIGRKYILLS